MGHGIGLHTCQLWSAHQRPVCLDASFEALELVIKDGSSRVPLPDPELPAAVEERLQLPVLTAPTGYGMGACWPSLSQQCSAMP